MKPLHCRDSITLVIHNSCTFREDYRTECRGVFRTLPNIQDVAFSKNSKRKFFSCIQSKGFAPFLGYRINVEYGSYHAEQRIGGKNCYL